MIAPTRECLSVSRAVSGEPVEHLFDVLQCFLRTCVAQTANTAIPLPRCRLQQDGKIARLPPSQGPTTLITVDDRRYKKGTQLSEPKVSRVYHVLQINNAAASPPKCCAPNAFPRHRRRHGPSRLGLRSPPMDARGSGEASGDQGKCSVASHEEGETVGW